MRDDVETDETMPAGGGPADAESALATPSLICDRWPRVSRAADAVGPVVHAVFRLSRINRTMIGGLLRDLGLAPGQELLLLQLWDRDGCSQTDLVERLGLDPSTVTKMLQRLERDGWVQRQASDEDGRVMVVTLTPAGRGLECEVTRLWAELERETVKALTDDERRQLLALLGKVEDGLHAAPPCAGGLAEAARD